MPPNQSSAPILSPSALSPQELAQAAERANSLRYAAAESSLQELEQRLAKVLALIAKQYPDQEDGTKAVALANRSAKAMIAPASQVAKFVEGQAGGVPLCQTIFKEASKALLGLCDLENFRTENDARIDTMFPIIASTFLVLGELMPTFKDVPALLTSLNSEVEQVIKTLKDFGAFCEVYYGFKDRKKKEGLVHLVHAAGNKETLAKFHDRFIAHRSSLRQLIVSHAALLSAANRDDLLRMDKTMQEEAQKLDVVSLAIVRLESNMEHNARLFMEAHGGETAVQNNTRLINEFARQFGDKSTELNTQLRKAMTQSTEEVLKQSQGVFDVKFDYAVNQLSARVDYTREAILKELNSGPYELITDPDIKNVWKTTSAKESSVKRRQLIDSLNYYFGRQFKQYKLVNSVDDNKAWTHGLLSQVRYHGAIADAIDTDSSGFISVTEVNEFLQRKPDKWATSQWIAYWAYGWDADNIEYQRKVTRALQMLKKLLDSSGPNTEALKEYLKEVEPYVGLFGKGCHPIRALRDDVTRTGMDTLRADWKLYLDGKIKAQLRRLGYRLQHRSTVPAVTGFECTEAAFLPLLFRLMSHHLMLFRKNAMDDGAMQDAVESVVNLVLALHDRILELRDIWHRQRVDLTAQVHYFANGLFEAYYLEHKAEFDEAADDDISSTGSFEDWQGDDSSDDDSKSVSDEEQLKVTTPQTRVATNSENTRKGQTSRGQASTNQNGDDQEQQEQIEDDTQVQQEQTEDDDQVQPEQTEDGDQVQQEQTEDDDQVQQEQPEDQEGSSIATRDPEEDDNYPGQSTYQADDDEGLRYRSEDQEDSQVTYQQPGYVNHVQEQSPDEDPDTTQSEDWENSPIVGQGDDYDEAQEDE